MSVYKRDVNIIGSTVEDKFTADEQHLYGSSRVGMKQVNIEVGGISFALSEYKVEGEFIVPGTVSQTGAGAKPVTERLLTTQVYELTNHLGNVIAVVGDKKLGIEAVVSGSVPVANYYLANVVSSGDYFSFGMQMVGRTFNSSDYRLWF